MSTYRIVAASRLILQSNRYCAASGGDLQQINNLKYNRFQTIQRTKHTQTMKKEKEKLRTYITQRYIDYVKNYTQVLEKRFPSAMRMYRIFSIGIKDFLKDLKTFITLRIKITKNGGFSNMTRQDIELYQKMPADMWRIAPVLILSAVPFGNYVIFPLAFLKPKKLLCSHFWSIQQRAEFSTEDLTDRLRYNKPVFRALQAKSDHIPPGKTKEHWQRILALLGSGVHPTAQEVLTCKELFRKEPYSLPNLSYAHMGYLLKMYGLRRSVFRRKKLKYRALLLFEMDKAIVREGGLESLSTDSLRNVCQIRGLNSSHLSNQDMRDWLQQWLNVSQNVDSTFLTIVCLVASKKPYSKRLLATWRLECELGIITDLDCPIDGCWSPWGTWSACHGTCDNVGHRKRIRECNNPPPSQDGMPCSGPEEQLEPCYLINCTTSDYRKIVEGDFPRSQALNQLEAMPGFMERCLQIECPFEAVEAALATENTWQFNSESLWSALQCVKHDIGCPVTGEWGAWGPWSSCGARCGIGQRWRTRQCDTPPPSAAHLVCTGAPLQYEECEGDQCAIDEDYNSQNAISGSWSEWGEWTKCSEKCGSGIRRRKRTCIEKNISNYAITWGTHCRGQYDQLQVCSNKKCLLNGGWSVWRAWGPCSQSCGAGRRSRTRSCTRPIPSGNGSDCVGPKAEVGSCHLQPCEVYPHVIGVFNGDSFLRYHFPRKRSTFFHFYIRFMPLSPYGNLLRRGTSHSPPLRLSLHKWHVCLDVSGATKSCSIPRMCSPTALEPATWNTLVITVTNEAANIRLNDAQASIRGSFPCDPEFTNDVMNIYLGERLHGEVQEVILNFIPLNMIIERERRSDRTDFFPSSASNMAYEKANMEEAYLNIQEDQYLRLPCFEAQDEWQLDLTIKSKREAGSIIFFPSDKNNKIWFYMALQNMRVKIKFAHNDFKSETTSSTECLPDQWLDISIVKKKETNTIEISLNAGERLHVLLTDDVIDNRESRKRFKSCNLNKQLIANQSTKNLQCKIYYINETKPQEICIGEFFVGGLPADIQNSLSEDFSPFTGVLASVRINTILLDLHDYSLERDKDGVVQVSSRTASISGSYHETAWGESNKLNLTCLYARNLKSPRAAYWLYMDTVLKFNRNVRSADDGRVLRLIVTADNDLKGFYTCRARGNKRTRNFVTYGVLGKINYKLSRPDTITVIAVCTTVALVIFTLAWLILEGYHDIRNGYGFYRDAHLSPEEEAEIICKYIDQNTHLIGSESAVNLAKANARRRGRRLASRASFGAQEPQGILKIEKEMEEMFSDCAGNELDGLPPLPETNVLGIEPSHEIYRCEQSYVSSPRHGSNITSYGKKITSSSSIDTSPRVLCSRLLMMKYKCSPKENGPKKNSNRSCYLNTRDKSRLLTIRSSTIVNKSPVQRVLEKFKDLKSEDT